MCPSSVLVKVEGFTTRNNGQHKTSEPYIHQNTSIIPTTELEAETAVAMAAASLVFKSEENNILKATDRAAGKRTVAAAASRDVGEEQQLPIGAADLEAANQAAGRRTVSAAASRDAGEEQQSPTGVPDLEAADRPEKDREQQIDRRKIASSRSTVERSRAADRPEKDREQQIGQGSSEDQNRSEQIARSNSRLCQSRARERLVAAAAAIEQPTIVSAAAELVVLPPSSTSSPSPDRAASLDLNSLDRAAPEKETEQSPEKHRQVLLHRKIIVSPEKNK
ncbi:hypothetical protein HAX54_017521 [Datura stramonium]|uniref:Uncharacterized protein n=1 Tax=Datura stramonium TaxID=4076 RepID=A0ABS8UMH7_DATST|nr:hypothetical protein [Datura stramonium]